MSRLPVRKTYKLYIGGEFPRSESGARTRPRGRTSRARRGRTCATPCAPPAAALPGWAGATAYNRGQVLYRIAEMMEARARRVRRACCAGPRRGRRGDRPLVVWYAGWADKLAAGARRARTPSPARTSTSPSPSRPASSASSRRRSRRSAGSSRASRRRSSAATPSSRSRRRRIRSPRSSSRRFSRPPTCPAGSSTSSPAAAPSSRPWLAAHMDVNAIDLTGAERRPRRARARGGRERQARRPRGAGRAEPLGDRALPRAEDRLAPGRALTSSAVWAFCVARNRHGTGTDPCGLSR